ncbi:unnamed protein product [Amoebophrya sp. A25]|nr:unnamed protein product [Amoebophrya sp. A25]|eukprot:GSA25T00026668001.1
MKTLRFAQPKSIPRANEASVDALTRSLLGETTSSSCTLIGITKKQEAIKPEHGEKQEHELPGTRASSSVRPSGRVLSYLRGLATVEYTGPVRIGERVWFTSDLEAGQSNVNVLSHLDAPLRRATSLGLGVVTGFSSKNAVSVSVVTTMGMGGQIGTPSVAYFSGEPLQLPHAFETAWAARSSITAGVNLAMALDKNAVEDRSQSSSSRCIFGSTSAASTSASGLPISSTSTSIYSVPRLFCEADRDRHRPSGKLVEEQATEIDSLLQLSPATASVASKTRATVLHSKPRGPRTSPIISGNYLVDLCEALRHGQRITLRGPTGGGKTHFLSSFVRNYTRGQSVVICSTQSARKYAANSVVFAQDFSDPAAGEHAWLTMLLGIQYAKRLQGSDQQPLLIIDDMLQFQDVSNPKAFLPITQLLREAFNSFDVPSASGGSTHHQSTLTVFTAVDAWTHSLAEDGADVVLTFEHHKPNFEDLRRYSRFTTGAFSTTCASSSHHDVHVGGGGGLTDRDVMQTLEDAEFAAMKASARQGSSSSSSSTPRTRFVERCLLEDQADSGNPHDITSCKPSPCRSGPPTSTLLDNIVQNLLHRTTQGMRMQDRLDVNRDLSIHVDTWDKEEANAMAAPEMILNSFNTKADARWRGSGSAGVQRTRLLTSSSSSDAESSSEQRTASLQEQDTERTSPVSALEKYKTKLVGKCAGIASILGRRATKKSTPWVSKHLNFENNTGVSSPSSEDFFNPSTTNGEGSQANGDSLQQSTTHQDLAPPVSREELAVLARACTIYHFAHKPSVVEAATFRKTFWHRFKSTFPQFLEAGMFEQTDPRKSSEILNLLDKALLEIRYDFELVRPTF